MPVRSSGPDCDAQRAREDALKDIDAAADGEIDDRRGKRPKTNGTQQLRLTRQPTRGHIALDSTRLWNHRLTKPAPQRLSAHVGSVAGASVIVQRWLMSSQPKWTCFFRISGPHDKHNNSVPWRRRKGAPCDHRPTHVPGGAIRGAVPEVPRRPLSARVYPSIPVPLSRPRSSDRGALRGLR